MKVTSGDKEAFYDFKGNKINPSYRTLEVSEEKMWKLQEVINSDNSLLSTVYLDKKKGDTIHVTVTDKSFMPKYSKLRYHGNVGIVEAGERWVRPPDLYSYDIELIDDKYALVRTENPKIQELPAEFKTYYSKLSELPPDASEYKNKILKRYPNIDLNSSKYVLFNLEKNTMDTVIMPKEFLDDQVYSYLYLDGEQFKNGFIRIYVSGEDYASPFHTFLSDKGRVLKPKQQYKKIYTDFNEHGQAVVNRSAKRKTTWGENFGVIDTAGNEMIPLDYSGYKLHEDGYILIRASDGKAGLVSFENQILMEFKYKWIVNLERDIYNPYFYTIEINLE